LRQSQSAAGLIDRDVDVALGCGFDGRGDIADRLFAVEIDGEGRAVGEREFQIATIARGKIERDARAAV
jgi:hypothetical protein